DELADRQAILRQLIHFSSVEFARTRWYDVDEVSQHLLRSLCGVFGASVVEIAWSDDEEGPLTLEACWSTQAEDGWTPNRLCAPGTLFEEINSGAPSAKSGAWSCDDLEALEPTDGAKLFLEAGLDAVVELRLSPDRPRAVLRLGFADGLGSWDEINTEPVSLLGLLVLSSLRRCRLEEALNERARRDSLTGVLNRGEFYQHLEVCIASPQQVGRVGVLYCDVDHFKATNDNHGHAAGDAVLRAVADAIRKSVREGDQVARVGGDEFVALCRGLESDAQLDAVKERVAGRLADLEFAGGAVSLSIGAAVLAEDQDADALVGAADAAMYRAKFRNRTGRGSGKMGDRVVEDAE
ncbi:MAG: diguanylate cyclase domain-containing protein, partial [Microthrixaceae bacterium]